jgi:hypothetical protein
MAWYLDTLGYCFDIRNVKVVGRHLSLMQSEMRSPACSHIITQSLMGGCENDIGRNRDPEGVVADKGDLDENPHDREPRKNERERESEIHCASPLRGNKETLSAWQGLSGKEPAPWAELLSVS